MNVWKQIMPAALSGLLTGATGFGAATNRYVAFNSTNPQYPYDSWSIAATNIIDAVAAANANNAQDTVYVSNGIYYVTNYIFISNAILQSMSTSRADTVINGNNYAGKPVTNRCCYLNHTNAVVDGFTITNGCADNGGGVYLLKGTVRNCDIVGNTATNAGGGVYATGASTLTNCNVNWNLCSNPVVVANTYGGGGVCLYQAAAGMVRNCTINSNTISTNNNGGGIYVYANGPVRDCLIQGNSAGSAGGIELSNGSSTVLASNCVIRGNSAAYNGGGVMIYGGASAGGRVSDCTIDGNTAGNYGGGAYLTAIVSGNFERTTVSSNTAHHGGGIYNSIPGITSDFVTNCLIIGNTALENGGGLYTYYSFNAMANCRIMGNSAGTNGGGVYLSFIGPSYYSGCRLRNFLIANNVAGNQGGGVYANRLGDRGGAILSSTIVSNYAVLGGGLILTNGNNSNTVVNTIIYSNAATVAASADLYDAKGDSGTSVSYSCTSSTNGFIGPGNITADPKFADAPAGNWRLGAYSPCINAGTNQDWMDSATDLDGQPRRRYNQVDIGAYEQIYSGTIFIMR